MATFFKTWQQWVAVAAVTLGLAGAARAEEAEAVETPEVTQAKAGEWITDYDRAAAAAAELGRPMLLDFTGSDWCGWCIRLDEEVFSKPEFTAYAEEALVLVKLDFPQDIPQSRELIRQNEALMEQYGVEGFPTIILVDADGEVLAETGYRRGGAEAYVKHLKELLKK